MVPDEPHQFPLFVPEVAENPGPCRAGLETCGLQPFLDPVITKGAFVNDLLLRVEETASVRTGLHAVFAPDAIRIVYQHDSVRRFIRGAHRANLYAGRFKTVVAHFGDE